MRPAAGPVMVLVMPHEATPPDGPPAAVAETHVSVVTMIGDRAYKLLKPVDLVFLDHRRREDRRAACLRETEVNRRFAPDVYLGVLDVIDEAGEPLDHLLVMRRMPAGRRLTALLGRGGAADRVTEVARLVAGFHAEAPRGGRISDAGTATTVRGLWEEGLTQLSAAAGGVLADDAVAAARRLARRYLAGRGPLLASRITAGWVRDGHGDLLADDVFCLDDGPRVLDCLAFDDRLRHGDVLLDVAFLAMDLEAHGHPGLSDLLIRTWAAELGEDHPRSLAHHYVAYRAHVRAKVACLRAAQGDAAAVTAARHLHALCLDRLERGRVRLVLVGGAPGTGKTTVAAALGSSLDAVVLNTDAIRKRREGAPAAPADPGPFDAGRYAPKATRAVYEQMLATAAGHLGDGRSAVLDASWADADARSSARALAEEASADVVEIRCVAPADVAEDRVARRRRGGEGPSDATPAIARAVAARFADWPEAAALPTDRARAEVDADARAIAGPA